MRTVALGHGKELGCYPKDFYMFTRFKTPLTGSEDETAYFTMLYCWKLKVPEVDKLCCMGKTYYVRPQHAPSAKAAKHLKEDVAKETILSFKGPGRRGA